MNAAAAVRWSEGGGQVISEATGVFGLTWLLVALPLAGAALLLLGGRRTNGFGPALATVLVGGSFVIGFVMFLEMLGRPGEERAFDQSLFTWAPVGDFSVDVGFQLDPLSMAFVLLVTFVGGLVHVYSLGYMAHDPDRRRFFAYLNLFVASMLLLVLANDFVLVYVGWEGVGLASYLLIGFWNAKPEYATAAKKAFVMNRVGDIGMSLAIMLMVATFGTTAFSGVFAGAEDASSGVLLALGLLLLLAATGKSAQLPLQAWLGDAMAGPTPVSALIHAATMVTAGVYLIVRSNPIFDLSDGARLGGRPRRCAHPAVRCLRRNREGRHQEGAGRLDDEPDRVHGARRRPRPGRLRVRDLPPVDPRLLQGRTVPRRRLGHARHGRRGQHAPLRRPAHGHADHLRHVLHRLPGHHRHPAVRRLLLQGQDHRGSPG